jgi:hypothetical protein
MVDNHAIQTSPSIEREIHGFLGETEIRHVAREHLDLRGAVLVVQLVECRVGPGDEDEFVGVGEEVVRDGEADAWVGGGLGWVWSGGKYRS